MVSCRFVSSFISPRLNTKKKRVIAPMSIGASKTLLVLFLFNHTVCGTVIELARRHTTHFVGAIIVFVHYDFVKHLSLPHNYISMDGWCVKFYFSVIIISAVGSHPRYG